MSSTTARAAASVPRRPVWRRSRACHGTLVRWPRVVAVFPVVWVLLTLVQATERIRRSEIQLIVDPTLDNYRDVLNETELPDLVPELGARRRVHHGARHLRCRPRPATRSAASASRASAG